MAMISWGRRPVAGRRWWQPLLLPSGQGRQGGQGNVPEPEKKLRAAAFRIVPGQNVSLVWSFGVTWAQSNPAGLTASRSSAVSSARLLLSGAQREHQLFNYDLVIIRAVGSVSGPEKRDVVFAGPRRTRPPCSVGLPVAMCRCRQPVRVPLNPS